MVNKEDIAVELTVIEFERCGLVDPMKEIGKGRGIRLCGNDRQSYLLAYQDSIQDLTAAVCIMTLKRGFSDFTLL